MGVSSAAKVGLKKILCLKGQTVDNWVDKTLLSWGSIVIQYTILSLTETYRILIVGSRTIGTFSKILDYYYLLFMYLILHIFTDPHWDCNTKDLSVRRSNNLERIVLHSIEPLGSAA